LSSGLDSPPIRVRVRVRVRVRLSSGLDSPPCSVFKAPTFKAPTRCWRRVGRSVSTSEPCVRTAWSNTSGVRLRVGAYGQGLSSVNLSST